MTTILLAGFLAAHGFVHLAIWLPHPQPQPAAPPPFAPDHSALLTAVSVPQADTHRLAVALAVAAGLGYLVAGLGVAVGGGWAALFVIAGAVVGLVLKLVFFNPWLTLGVLLDAAALTSVLVGWPMSLP